MLVIAGALVLVGAVVVVGAVVLAGVVVGVTDHWAYRVTLADNVRFDSAAMSSPVPSDAVDGSDFDSYFLIRRLLAIEAKIVFFRLGGRLVT